MFSYLILFVGREQEVEGWTDRHIDKEKQTKKVSKQLTTLNTLGNSMVSYLIPFVGQEEEVSKETDR